jgi:Domain of unknown function (DUF5916)
MLPWLLALSLTAVERPAGPPVLRAVALETPPVMDGDVIGDPAWSAVGAADTFWQTAPEAGQPASERTELRVGYTAESLYVSVVCYDRQPSAIVVAGSRRDASLEDGDSVALVLDTFLDRQNGFVFGTNPAGIEYDAQLTREGSGDSDFNLNWDGAWTVRTQTGDYGWSAEFEIPWKTLRYGSDREQVWGLNVQRNIRRHKESAYWAPLERQHGLERVSSAGTIEGLAPPAQRNLKLTPYALGSLSDAARGGNDTDGQVGADLKWSVTPSLTFDLTANTDFAQVEADEQQVNLNRFSLFFPEKRPFFLENSGLFAMGSSGETDLFFSRRIGIGPGGVVVPILGGARLSGRTLGMNVGLLNMQTKRLAGVTPAQNFTALRFEKELANRSGVAVLFTNRTATGEDSVAGDTGRTYGAEGRLGLGRYAQFSGYVAKTDTPGVVDDAWAVRGGADWSSPGLAASLGYRQVGEGFDPQVGFLSRQGYRKPTAFILHRRRMNGRLGLQEIRPHASYEGYWKPDGFQESGFLHVDNHWEWRSGFEVHTGVNFTREGLREPFEIAPGVLVPPDTYDHEELQVVVITNQGKPLSFDGTAVIGGFFGGHRRSWRPTLQARRGERLSLALSYEREDVELPGGNFATNLAKARLSWSWTPRLFLQGLVQYNDQAELWSANVRFGWLSSGNTGLFVVYNENRDLVGPGSSFRDRSLTLKWSRLVDLLD